MTQDQHADASHTDHSNTVELLGHYGGDVTHACSAWTSTSRDLDIVEKKTGKTRRERIPELLKQLATSSPPHTSPFEKSFIHFLLKNDKATHIHLIKHRIAVSVNAESARYKELKEDNWYYPSDWPTENEGTLEASMMFHAYADIMRDAHHAYHKLVKLAEEWFESKGMSQPDARKRAKESARFVLPHASQVQQDVSFNFLSFMHFQKLRNHPHAQREVRLMAQEMLDAVVNIPGSPFRHSLAAFGY